MDQVREERHHAPKLIRKYASLDWDFLHRKTIPQLQGDPEPAEPDLDLAGLPDIDLAGLPDLDFAGLPDPDLAGLPDLDLAGLPDPDLDLAGLPEPDLARLPDLADPDLDRADPLLDRLEPLRDLDPLGDLDPDFLEPDFERDLDLDPDFDRDLDLEPDLEDLEPDLLRLPLSILLFFPPRSLPEPSPDLKTFINVSNQSIISSGKNLGLALRETIFIFSPPSSSLELLSLFKNAFDLIFEACFLESFSVPAATLSAFFLAFL